MMGKTSWRALRGRGDWAQWIPIGCASLVLLGAAECGKARLDNPVDAYTSFSRAVQKGEYKAAFASLSSETQRLLEERADQISQAAAGAIRDDPAALTFSTPGRPEPLIEVKLMSEDGNRATVIASSSSVSEQIQMVREQAGWKVDLSDAIRSRMKASP